MKQRIQEALRRRHRKEDEGFTLIELLVVILIIAILAAVGIVALLGALRSGKKSASKTALTNAVLTVKAVQTGDGTDDFSTVTVDTLNAAESDLEFQTAVPDIASGPNQVGTYGGGGGSTDFVLVVRDANNDCYAVHLHTDAKTEYGADKACATSVNVSDFTWDTSQKVGWKTPS